MGRSYIRGGQKCHKINGLQQIRWFRPETPVKE